MGLHEATIAILERQLIAPAAMAKSTAATERMIASTDFIKSGTFRVVNDSTAYFYQGQRGNVFNEAGFPVADGMEFAATVAPAAAYSEMIDFTKSTVNYDSAVTFDDAGLRKSAYRKIFDSRGNVSSMWVSRFYTISGVSDFSVHTFTYNVLDLVQNISVESVDPGSGRTEPRHDCSISYSASLRVTDSLHNSALNVPLRKHIYQYDGGSLVRRISLDWGAGSWDTTGTSSYEYDALGRIVAHRYEGWDPSGNGSIYVDSLAYQGFWRTSVTVESKSMTMAGLQDGAKTVFTLNSKGKPEKSEYYLRTQMGWQMVSRSRMQFNSSDHIVSHSTRSTAGATDSLHSGYYYAAQPTRIQMAARPLEIIVYPNPVSGYVTLTIPGFRTSGNVELSDVLGRKVLNVGISGETCRLSLSGLSRGAYFLTVNANGERVGKSIVLQ